MNTPVHQNKSYMRNYMHFAVKEVWMITSVLIACCKLFSIFLPTDNQTVIAVTKDGLFSAGQPVVLIKV